MRKQVHNFSKQRKILFEVVVTFCLLILSMSVRAELQRPLKVLSDVWPPFVMDDPLRPGIDVEVMQAVFERIGIEYTFEIVPWRRAVIEVSQGQADALLDVFKTPDRLEKFLFHDTPLNQTSSALFCLRCDPNVSVDESDLKSKVLIINRGYKFGRFGNDDSLKRFEVDSFEQGFRMLAAGRADYYLVNRVVGLYVLAELKLTDILPLSMEIEDPSQVYLGFYRSDQLVSSMNEFEVGLRNFLGSPEHTQILKKYGVIAP